MIILIYWISGFLTLLYVGLMCYFLWGWKKLKPEVRPGRVEQTTISVVIACRNEEKNLPSLFYGLENQDYSNNLWEVILVDDHSEDQTLSGMQAWKETGQPFDIQLLSLSTISGKKNAVRAGISLAKGEWILCTDADCYLSPEWIHSMAKYAQQPGLQMILGPVRFRDGRGFLNAFQRFEMMGLMSVSIGAAGQNNAFLANGANLMFRKEAFRETGERSQNPGYSSGDDVFLLHAFKRRFGKTAIRFCHHRNAWVETPAASGWIGFFRQRMRWASKTRAYTDPMSVFTAFLVYLENLALLIVLITGLIAGKGLLTGCLFLFLKVITDAVVVRKIIVMSASKPAWPLFVMAAVFNLPYVVFTGVLSQVARFTWKGRSVR